MYFDVILYYKVHPTTGHEDLEAEQRYSNTLSLTLKLVGVCGLRIAPLPPAKKPGTYCIGGKVSPTAGLDSCGKSHLHRAPIPGL